MLSPAPSAGVRRRPEAHFALQLMMTERGGRVYFPRPEFCTDNGAMIAYAGYLRLKEGQSEPLAFAAHPRWELARA